MKKHMKKIVSLALTLIMVFAMSATAFAADTYTISVPSTDNHTYSIYQIFTGTLSADGSKLSDVKWGANGNGTGAVAEEVLAKLAALGNASDSVKLATIKQYANLDGDAFAIATKDSSAEVPAGYYLIKDSVTIEGQDTATLYIVKVVEDQVIERKADVPSSEKKVQDVNDSTDSGVSDWQDSADWDIGDDVPFQLKATLGSDYDNYKVYKLTFHDKESAGLTFKPDTVKVYVDGTEITTGFEVVTTDLADDCTFEVKFADTKLIPSIKAGSVITVEYKSTLNESAVLGSVGNPNTSNITFSNNPNDEQGGENGSTPDDTVIVFTYKTVINKIDKDNNPLSGATFTLEKKIKGENGAEDTWQEIDVVITDNGTVFTFSGLDDGEYRLVETVAPDGYNKIDPIYFTITATHDISSDNPALTGLNGNAATGEITFVSNIGDGSLTTDVINNSGVELPETGGIGTTIFYVIGASLMLVATVLLITRKKMQGHNN